MLDLSNFDHLNCIDGKMYFVLVVMLSGPDFNDKPDEERRHFISVKYHEPSQMWLVIGPEQNAQYIKATPENMKLLLSDGAGHQMLSDNLAIPFGEENTLE